MGISTSQSIRIPSRVSDLVSVICLAFRRIELQEFRGVSADDGRFVVLRQRVRTIDEPDRIVHSHVEWIVRSQNDVIAAVEGDEILELMLRKDDGVEIELAQIARGRVRNAATTVFPRAVCMIDSTGIRRQITASVGDADLELRVAVQHAVEDQMVNRNGGIQRITDHINKVVIRESLPIRKTVRMQKDQHVTKREQLSLTRELNKLEQALGGIKEMGGTPDIMFVVDTNKESIAIREANRLGIPVVAVLDSNSDPAGVDYPIPGNDDAGRAIALYCDLVSKAVIDGISRSASAQGVDLGAAEEPVAETVLDEPAADKANGQDTAAEASESETPAEETKPTEQADAGADTAADEAPAAEEAKPTA